jgi:hypothetical protein
VGPIAIFFGVLLTVLGIGLYALSDSHSPTALIPSAFGVVLILLGFIARGGSEKVRMHTMHAAALIGLVGLVFPAYRAIAALAGGAEMNLAIGGQIAMAVLCGGFLALCIKSFIDARRARKQRELSAAPQTGPGGPGVGQV